MRSQTVFSLQSKGKTPYEAKARSACIWVQLRVMREKEPSAKALVSSQFASTIDWLKVKLQEQGFGYRTISGSMTLKQRSKVSILLRTVCKFAFTLASSSTLSQVKLPLDSCGLLKVSESRS